MATFDTGTGSQGYASEGYRPGSGVTRIKGGKAGESGRIYFKQGRKATRKASEQPKEYTTTSGAEVKVQEESSYPETQRLTEKTKQTINVEVNKEQVEALNKEINAKELSTALIEGRVTKYKKTTKEGEVEEGFQVTGKSVKETQTLPPPDEKKLYAPRTISPQETQPVISEVKFVSPFPPNNPYPNSMNAAKPNQKYSQPKDILHNPIDLANYYVEPILKTAGEKTSPELLAVPSLIFGGIIGAEKIARHILTEPEKLPGELLQAVQEPEVIIGLGVSLVNPILGIAIMNAKGVQEATIDLATGNYYEAGKQIGSIGFQYGLMETGGLAIREAIIKPLKAEYKSYINAEEGLRTRYPADNYPGIETQPFKNDLNNKWGISGTPGVIIPERFEGMTNPPEVQFQLIPKKLPEETPMPEVTWKTSRPANQRSLPSDFFQKATTEEVNAWLQETGQTNFPKIEFNKEISPEEIIKQVREQNKPKTPEQIEAARLQERKEWQEIREQATKDLLEEPKTPEQIAIEQSNEEIFNRKSESQTDLSGQKVAKPTDNVVETTTESTGGGGQFSELTLIMKPKKPTLILPPEESFKPSLPPQARNTINERIPITSTTIPIMNIKQPSITQPVTIQTPSTRIIQDIQVRTTPTTTTITSPVVTIIQDQRTGGVQRTRTQTQTAQTQITEQAQAQEQIQQQEQILQQVQQTKQNTITNTITNTRPQPTETKIPFPSSRGEEETRTQSPFNIKVRRKGIFQSVGQEKSLSKAINKAESIVENTAAASFKIEQGGRPVTGFNPGSEFKPSKKEKGVFIQEEKFRIGTPGEKAEITQRGIFASKIKKKSRRKGRWGF